MTIKRFAAVVVSFVLGLMMVMQAGADPCAGWAMHYTDGVSYPLAANNLVTGDITSATWNPVGLTTVNDSRTVYSDFDSGDYIEFSVSIAAGKQMSFDNFYHCGATLTSLELELYSSVDNYTTSLGSYTMNDSYINYFVDLTNASLQDVTGTVSFRLQWAGDSGGSSYEFFAVTPTSSYPGYDSDHQYEWSTIGFSGNISVVPEPVTVGLIGIGALVFAVNRRARKRVYDPEG